MRTEAARPGLLLLAYAGVAETMWCSCTVSRFPGAPFGSTVTTRPSAASIVPRTRPVTTGAPGASGKSCSVTIWPLSPRMSFVMLLPSIAVLDHGQEVAGGVLEPGDVRAPILRPAAQDAFLVGLRTAVVVLELHAPASQLVDRRIDVVNHEVQNGEGGRLVITFRICKHRST